MQKEQFKTTEHDGGVMSRTSDFALVQEPVVVTIDGVDVELTLDDAKDLLSGLQAAVANVEASEASVAKLSNGHTFVLGKTRHGMSLVVPSRLGKNPLATAQARIAAKFGCGIIPDGQ